METRRQSGFLDKMKRERGALPFATIKTLLEEAPTRAVRKVKPEDLTIVEPMNVKPKMDRARAELVAKMEL